MREIKFKAWDKKRKVMTRVMRLTMGIGIRCYVPDGKHHDWYEEDEGDYSLHWSDVELLQYTGLTDKNGKEIYEGDIVKWDSPYGGRIGEIYWKESEGGFYHTFTDEDGDVRPSKRLWDIIEVIGNAYENEELLK